MRACTCGNVVLLGRCPACGRTGRTGPAAVALLLGLAACPGGSKAPSTQEDIYGVPASEQGDDEAEPKRAVDPEDENGE
ncbi:MAG: hypothetical protein H6737_17815 [Alphaproteobacteria bacterium]|nr:hypothetical protein [Alphaproteobacteria bacterium]